MANTKKSQTKSGQSNKSTKTKSSGKNTKNSRKKKNSSDDTMKFLLVLIIAGIAIALIFLSGPKEEDPAGPSTTGTPAPTETAGATEIPEQTPATEMKNTPAPTETQAAPENTPAPTEEASVTNTPVPTEAVQATSTPTPTVTPTPTPTNTPTPTPTPVLSAAEAEKVVKEKVDTSVYDVQMVNENLVVGNGRYYQFGAIKNQEFVAPFLAVSKADGSLHFYDSTEGTVFDFTKFPVKAEATPTPTPTPEPAGKITAKEAYQILCTYSKEALHTAKEIKEYEPEYDEELTFINGTDCYRITLFEQSGGKRRNRGEFYISVDGTKCYSIDSNTNEFVLVVK